MQAGAGDFAAGPEAGDRRPAFRVNCDPAHMVVLCGPDGDRLARRVNAGRSAGRRNDREARGEAVANRAPGVEKHAVARCAPPPDCSSDDVSRSKLGAGRLDHEPVAGFVDQDRAFASHSLADERHRPCYHVESGRVELYELHVSQNGAGAGGQRQTLPKTAHRIGAVGK